MENIIFYNLYNNGDVYLTIKFIEDIITKTNMNITYVIRVDTKPYKQFNINFINYSNFKDNNLILDNFKYYHINKTLYYNLHVLKMNGFLPENHIDIKYLYDCFKPIYRLLNIKIKDNYSDYMPIVNNIYNIDEKCKDSILICNGPCLSEQLKNVNESLNYIIRELSTRYVIFLTHQEHEQYNNVIYIKDIYPQPANIHFIGFFARCVDYIIGKDSGLFYWTQNIDTIDKKFICLALQNRYRIDPCFNVLRISPNDTNEVNIKKIYDYLE
jgi:hypothetical protein